MILIIKTSKFEWLRLQLWITKKQWLTDMQESLLFVSVVESSFWAFNSSMASSLLIMLIKSISRFLSLQSFYLLSHTVDIHTKACCINFFVFFSPTIGFCISFTHNAIQSKNRSSFDF